jgi:hypothetical protein
MTKVQLTLTPGYVEDWTVVEAIRELFQNALDNQTVNPENEMYFNYDGEVLRIGNKTSILPLESLLLGSSTKRNDDKTIGKHGEGYKVAILVLLRLGKKITFYNYGKREVWTTRLIKSRKFNNALIPEITVNRKFIWSKVPSHDLIIEVEGVTQEDYNLVVDSNLHLQHDVERKETADNSGSILMSEKYKGKLYVNGLFVGHNKQFSYGYDVKPSQIRLDRDRRLVDTVNLAIVSSKIWIKTDDEALMAKLVSEGIWDVKYVKDFMWGYSSPGLEKRLGDLVKQNFIEEHGEYAVPVSSNEELDQVLRSGTNYQPKMVSESVASFIRKEDFSPSLRVATPRDRLKAWFEVVRGKLSEEDISDFQAIFDDLK